MDESLYRWVTPEGEELRSNNFWGLIYKYFLYWIRTRVIHISQN
jgi:hypothetical protein